jgi:hypothetical protein
MPRPQARCAVPLRGEEKGIKILLAMDQDNKLIIPEFLDLGIKYNHAKL